MIIEKENLPELEGKEKEVAEEIRDRMYNEIEDYIKIMVENGIRERENCVKDINKLFSEFTETRIWRNGRNYSLNRMMDLV